MSMKVDIGLNDGERESVADGLARFLADTYTLYFKTHYYHWNVTGPQFRALHLMFEEQYNELWTAVDEVAERIRALGKPAPGSYDTYSKLTSIEKDGNDVPDADAMVANLVKGHETATKTAREVLKTAEQAGDEVSVDLLIGRMQVHEKTAWMLRSMVDAK